MHSYQPIPANKSTLLKVEGLDKAFNGLEVLSDINFTLENPNFVTFLGPSGCGKSTLFKILLELLKPDRGEIHRGYKSSGYLPQEGLLFPWKTLIQNVELPLELHGTNKKERRKRAKDHLDTFGLAGFEDSYPYQLSGGMRQRAALLRTILTDAPVLFLDEPFGSLDALTRDKLQRWLFGILEEFDQTILFITHDVEEAVFLSETIILFTDRPAHKKAEISVNLSKTERDKTNEDFFNYQKKVFTYIEEEKYGQDQSF